MACGSLRMCFGGKCVRVCEYIVGISLCLVTEYSTQYKAKWISLHHAFIERLHRRVYRLITICRSILSFPKTCYCENSILNRDNSKITGLAEEGNNWRGSSGGREGRCQRWLFPVKLSAFGRTAADERSGGVWLVACGFCLFRYSKVHSTYC